MSFTIDYLIAHKAYDEKYGEKTVVLVENGKFYDIYQYNPDDDPLKSGSPYQLHKNVGRALEMRKLLNLNLMYENSGEPHSIKNTYRVGFPVVAYERHKNVLLDNGYTIVRIDQRKRKDPTEEITRYVAEVISPGTAVEHVSAAQTVGNYLVCLYIEVQKLAKKPEDSTIIIGLSAIDVSTGKNAVSETYSDEDHKLNALQEAYRFLIAFQPKEILVYITEINFPSAEYDKYKVFVERCLEADRSLVYTFRTTVNQEFRMVAYHQQFLSRIFCKSGITMSQTIIEDLDLSRYHYGTISYVLLLQFCYERDEGLLKNLNRPDTTWIKSEHGLNLTENAALQINVVSKEDTKRNYDSLFSVINNTSTRLGERLLKAKLLNPMTNVDEIEKYYVMTDELLSKPSVLTEIERRLKTLPDLEKLHRKLELNRIRPVEFASLFRAYSTIVDIYTLIINSGLVNLQSVLFVGTAADEFNHCVAQIFTDIDFDILSNCDLGTERMETEKSMISYIKPGRDLFADQHQSSVSEFHKFLEIIRQHLNLFIWTKQGPELELTIEREIPFRLKKNKKNDQNEEEHISDRIGFFISEAKANALRKNLSSIDPNICGNVTLQPSNKLYEITSHTIKHCCQLLLESQIALETYLYQHYIKMIENITNQYKFFSDVNRFVALLDYIKSAARTAIKYKYSRPTIVKATIDDDASFVKIEDMRHPVIERIIDAEYITNSIELRSPPHSEKRCGMLLFGCNSTGKTALATSVGLNIILGQIGLFTAGRMTYRPYIKLITRLSGHFDIMKGKSSFIVEMIELNTILRHSDNKTLVLGDELCRGTETASGTGLTVATILILCQRKSSFIFSTHMHNLPDIEEIEASPVRICHLTTSLDNSTGEIIFDRKLGEGQGNSVYGIEVARSVGLDKDFLDIANKIRRRILNIGEIVKTKRSRYNSSLYVDHCEFCGSREDLQTHHIREQSEADANGFIGHMHKNIRSNLLILCRSCHVKHHSSGQILEVKQVLGGHVVRPPEKK